MLVFLVCILLNSYTMNNSSSNSNNKKAIITKLLKQFVANLDKRIWNYVGLFFSTVSPVFQLCTLSSSPVVVAGLVTFWLLDFSISPWPHLTSSRRALRLGKTFWLTKKCNKLHAVLLCGLNSGRIVQKICGFEYTTFISTFFSFTASGLVDKSWTIKAIVCSCKLN